MNVPLSQINDNSGAETLQEWDSFKMYVLINEVEEEFNIKFSLEIKNVSDFKKQIEKHGINIME